MTADLGFNALEPLQKEFRERFVNVGVAEANMIGVAAGLALEGKKVIAYSIASFAAMRGYEQIRNDICYHNLDVKIVGTGGGYNYSTHGVTHQTVEDTAIMAALPHMKVFSPSYAWEARETTRAMLQDVGPAYIRLGKAPKDDFSQKTFKFEIGKAFTIREGKDIFLAVTGNLLDYACMAADIVEKESGLGVRVVSFPTIKPFDTHLVSKACKDCALVAVMEEHGEHGSLASSVALAAQKSGLSGKRFLTLGTPDHFLKEVGWREHLLKKTGLDPHTVARKLVQNSRRVIIRP